MLNEATDGAGEHRSDPCRIRHTREHPRPRPATRVSEVQQVVGKPVWRFETISLESIFRARGLHCGNEPVTELRASGFAK